MRVTGNWLVVFRFEDGEDVDCPSSNKWDRCLVLLREYFAHHFHVTQRVVDSANDVSR